MTVPDVAPTSGIFPLDFPAHIIYNIKVIWVQEERYRTWFGSWNIKTVRLLQMLDTPLSFRETPQIPPLNVRQKCARISLTTYLTTTSFFS